MSVKWGAKIDGTVELSKKFAKMTPLTIDAMNEAIKDAVLAIHLTAIKSIQEHRSSGIEYKKGKHGDILHTASLPGYPPNSDEGDLVQSIGWDINPRKLSGIVGTDSIIGYYLEFGTKHMFKRPWLGPATRKHKDDVPKNAKKIFDKMINKLTEK